jgi:predicted RNA-binding protein YlqC (UPF0109 family)
MAEQDHVAKLLYKMVTGLVDTPGAVKIDAVIGGGAVLYRAN